MSNVIKVIKNSDYAKLLEEIKKFICEEKDKFYKVHIEKLNNLS